jgi:hypothetical protein
MYVSAASASVYEKENDKKHLVAFETASPSTGCHQSTQKLSAKPITYNYQIQYPDKMERTIPL